MKQVFVGGISLLAGIILYGFTLVAASVYTISAEGYYTNLGKFGTALKEIGTFPLVISGILVIAGIFFLISGFDGIKNKAIEYMNL